MRGFITEDVTAKEKPNTQAHTGVSYRQGEFVEVTDSVASEEYAIDDPWYLLNTGEYLLSTYVELRTDCSHLADHDRIQYLISFRNINPDATIKEDSRSAPNKLYFAPLRLPANSIGLKVNEWPADTFVNTVIGSLDGLRPEQKHVFIYIPGYQLQMLSEMRLDLMAGFALNYLSRADNTLAKILFFSWPSQSGPSRKLVDDRSVAAGRNFTDKGLFTYFEKLSIALKKKGKTLNLLVHSFGHQLLNGMINPDDSTAVVPARIFENIFLMAPDITYRSVQRGGFNADNVFSTTSGNKMNYDLSKLSVLSHHVRVFQDRYDYLLYSSTVRFSGKKRNIDPQYFNLGNYGQADIAGGDIENNFNFYCVDDLIEQGQMGSLWDYPYTPFKGTSYGDAIDLIYRDKNYSDISAFKIAIKRKLFEDHHKYFFTCKPVVDKVLEILNESVAPGFASEIIAE